jgi:hypothetical protein
MLGDINFLNSSKKDLGFSSQKKDFIFNLVLISISNIDDL